ncbi:MAG: LysE family transporter [Thermodesulfobacteriota bacterium]
MEWGVFFEGLAAGFVVCAPMGPVGLVCLRRCLIEGPLEGFVSLLGASTADALYCFIAGLGVAYIGNFLFNEQTLISLLGGAVLVALGFKLFFTRPKPKANDCPSMGLLDAYASSFLLMLANPMLIVVFTALFTALGVHGWRGNYFAMSMAGVLAGSVLWAPIMVLAVRFFRPSMRPEKVLFLNKISGVIIAAFGVATGILGLMD